MKERYAMFTTCIIILLGLIMIYTGFAMIWDVYNIHEADISSSENLDVFEKWSLCADICLEQNNYSAYSVRGIDTSCVCCNSPFRCSVDYRR